jgi:hypothetical protein
LCRYGWVRKSVTGRLSVNAGKHEEVQSLEAQMADLKAGGLCTTCMQLTHSA